MDKNVFRNPPMEYRGAPFWSWNGLLNVDETRRQVRDMAEHGFGGAFLHARAGLATEYMSEDWFANCAAAIDESAKMGFSAWLYDEDRWPSGNGGGRTAASNADFHCRELRMWRAGEEKNDLYDRVAELARFRRVGENEFVRAQPHETGQDVFIFYSAVLPSRGLDGYFPDLLHPEAVKTFLANTHEVYRERFGGEFGKTIPGMFTDEPSLGLYPWDMTTCPWSVKMSEVFRARHHYELLDELPALFFATANAARVRHDFWGTVYHLFTENFSRQIGEWCRRSGLIFTGHYLFEVPFYDGIRCGGGIMRHYLHQQMPGIDFLREQLLEILTVKQASSICNQFDKPRLLSETYGTTGYGFSFEDQKRLGDWQMVLGVNFLCQHLTHYTMKGEAKLDYPPSYSYQSPWWRHFRHIADYQTRLSYALSQGRAVRDILVIHPLSGCWSTYQPGPGGAEKMWELEEHLNLVARTLASRHRDFDFGDETVMAEHAAVEGNTLRVGSAKYALVIVPPTPNLESTTLDLLERFVESGGKVLFLRPGEYITAWRNYENAPMESFPLFRLENGAPSQRPMNLINRPQVWRGSHEPRELALMVDRLLPRKFSIIRRDSMAEAADVLCQHRMLGDKHLFFTANSSNVASQPLRVKLCIKGRWEIWDCESGEVASLPSQSTEEGSEADIDLQPVGSALIVVDQAGQAAVPAALPVVREVIPLNPDGNWSFRRLAPNSIVLERCAYSLNNEPFSDEMFMRNAQWQWRKRLNVRTTGEPWQMLKNPKNLETVARVTLRHRFSVRDLPAGETFLVIEDIEQVEASLNGMKVPLTPEGWFMDRAYLKIPVGAFLQTGENVLALNYPVVAARRVEDIYLVGNFGVNQADFALIKEPSQLRIGDWCPQGYPTYAEGIIYETDIDVIGGGRRWIEFDSFAGTVAAIHVNQKRVAVIGWRPYRAEITQFLRPGVNKIGIEIVGSARNLMGPRHHVQMFPPWVGEDRISDTREPRYHVIPLGLTGPARLILR